MSRGFLTINTSQCWLTGQDEHVASHGCPGNLVPFWQCLSLRKEIIITYLTVITAFQKHYNIPVKVNTTALADLYAVTNIHNKVITIVAAKYYLAIY